jgi:hypothetical protein
MIFDKAFKLRNLEREERSTKALKDLLPNFQFYNTALKNAYLTDENGFCNVDYVVRHNDKFVCFLEVRTRSNIEFYVKNDKYQSLFLGKTKLENISKYYCDTIIVWFDERNLENLYYTTYHHSLLSCPIEYNFQKPCYKINRKFLSSGLDNLAELIVSSSMK